MQYFLQKIYFFSKIFGHVKKKLYLCTLNCEFENKHLCSNHEEKYTDYLALMLLAVCDGGGKGAEIKRCTPL